MLLDIGGRRTLVVGNECMGFLPDAELGCEVVLFQDFSLLGQPRGDSRPLGEILASFGIEKGSRVGCVGWKCFDSALVPAGPNACDIPAYVVDLLRDLTGDPRSVVNATAIFMNPADGLRTACEPVQIAQFEVASTFTSEGVRAVLRHLREGVEEQSLEHLLDYAGLPLSCHRMIGFGAKARRGLASPSPNRASLGDPFTVGFGLVGALTFRAGCIARGPADLPAGNRQLFADLAANYFDVVCTWYEQVRVGTVARRSIPQWMASAIRGSIASRSIPDTCCTWTSGCTRRLRPTPRVDFAPAWQSKWTSSRFRRGRSSASTPKTGSCSPTRTFAARWRSSSRPAGSGPRRGGNSCGRRLESICTRVFCP